MNYFLVSGLSADAPPPPNPAEEEREQVALKSRGALCSAGDWAFSASLHLAPDMAL